MANKLTIDQINERLDELHTDLTRTVGLINKYRKLRRDIRRGKVKQPPPKGVKVMLPKDAPFDDSIADLGVAPGTNGPC